MADTLTWLHLSDLHMQLDQLDDLRIVIDALLRDLPAQIDNFGGQLDFIAFSGDIASWGESQQYRLAEEYFFRPLLDVTGLTPARLFLVPGNHDVDWEAMQLINPNIGLSLTNRDEVTRLLKDVTKRRLLFTPMASYAEFIRRLFTDCPDCPELHRPPYSYVRTIAREALTVSVIGLNSAWLSGFTRDAEGRVLDHGNLLIGDKQVADAITKAQRSSLRIAVMHHPLSWLKEFDERDVSRWLRSACDFVLIGHLHSRSICLQRVLGRDTITIPAGTVYRSREWLNGYNLVQLDFEAGLGRIALRRYSKDLHEWEKDVQSTGDELGGLIQFGLPGALEPAAGAPSSQVLPESEVFSQIEPKWLALGREREIQLLKAFLEPQRGGGDTLWIWGEEECGLTEFLKIVRASLRQEPADVIYFDGEDADFGIAVDQHYFLDKLERWAGAVSEMSLGRRVGAADERVKSLLADAEDRLAKSGRRPVLIFANYHLLIPAIREWVWRSLWGQLLKPLRKRGALAIFACEGRGSACPASDQENRIYLSEFTVQDVERFLHTLSYPSEKIPELARRIHSEARDEFLTPPRRVYQKLVAELGHLKSL